MVVARVLTLWSTAALDCLQGTGQSFSPCVRQLLGGGSELQRRLLEHIYSHWEHPLDGVRYQARTLFRNLLLLHQQTNPPSVADPTADPYVSELAQSLLRLEWHMRGKYGSLGCLVELYGAGYLLDTEPKLPSCLLGLMGDQSLAPYASDLLERLFSSHQKQLVGGGAAEDWMPRWHQTWVTPLLQALCRASVDQTTYILDYVLPKLLRCSPSSLAHMVHVLQQMPPSSKGKADVAINSSPGSAIDDNICPGAFFFFFRLYHQQGSSGSSDDLPARSQGPGRCSIIREGSLGGAGASVPPPASTRPQA